MTGVRAAAAVFPQYNQLNYGQSSAIFPRAAPRDGEKPCRLLPLRLQTGKMNSGAGCMAIQRKMRVAILGGLVVTLAGCGILNRGPNPDGTKRETALTREDRQVGRGRTSTIWDVFNNSADANTTVGVNKYLWNASLDVLNFLPIQSVDPFSGVIVTGYGTPPGGGRAYRATIYVQDPALEARSLKVALQTGGGGAVPAETVRAVEDAILTRARQLRIRDSKL